MAKWYRKEIPGNPIHFSIGRAIPFEAIDRDYGYFATDNGWEIKELDAAVASHRGGVTEISQAEYEDFLKKKASAPSLRSLQPQRQHIGSRSKQGAPNRSVAPAGASILGNDTAGTPVTGVVRPQKAEGLKVDREFVKPKAGRIPSMQI